MFIACSRRCARPARQPGRCSCLRIGMCDVFLGQGKFKGTAVVWPCCSLLGTLGDSAETQMDSGHLGPHGEASVFLDTRSSTCMTHTCAPVRFWAKRHALGPVPGTAGYTREGECSYVRAHSCAHRHVRTHARPSAGSLSPFLLPSPRCWPSRWLTSQRSHSHSHRQRLAVRWRRRPCLQVLPQW